MMRYPTTLLTTTDRPIAFTMATSSPQDRVEPVTLAWVKQQLRFPTTAEDALLTTFIAAARTHFEEQTGRQCIDAEWEYALDGVPFGSCLELPRPPLASVTAVTYDDANGVAQTLDPATYRVIPSFVAPDPGSPTDPIAIDPYCACGRIELAAGGAWPTTSGLAGSLRVRRVCGYGTTPDAMPALIQATLGLLVRHFHDREAGELPLGPQALITAFKWTALPTQPPRSWAATSTWRV